MARSRINPPRFSRLILRDDVNWQLELIKHILGLSEGEQLAIIQAIVSNLQSKSAETPEILALQLAYTEAVASSIDKGTVKTVPLEDFEAEMAQRRSKRKPG